MTAFLDLVQTEKSNETYFKFIKYLEEDYDWLAWTLKNTQITSDEILEYNKSSSPTCESSERERERERERGRGRGRCMSGQIRSCQVTSGQDSERSTVRLAKDHLCMYVYTHMC